MNTKLGDTRFALLAAVLFGFRVGVVDAQIPYSITQVAGPVRSHSAALNGMAVPRGNATTVWFEWGSHNTYGNLTQPEDIGSGGSVVRVSALLTNLDVGAILHFRLVASNAVGVAHGFDNVFTTGMKVQNWGSFSYGAPVIPSGLTNVVGVAAGHGHCLAIRDDGTVAAWLVGFAYPAYGQASVPSDLTNVVAVAGGYSHSLALKEDGTVVAWGKYANGVVANVPGGLSNVIAIGGGDYHSVALRMDGTVTAWGSGGAYGTAVTNVPTGLSNVVAISCGSGHTLALKAEGPVAIWGGDNGAIAPPASASNLVSVATMGWWNLALRKDGVPVEWGFPFSSDVSKPSGLTNGINIATGYSYAEVLRSDGTLVGWGRGADAANIPPELSNVVAFASGDYHRIGLAPINLPPTISNRTLSGGTNQPLVIPLQGLDRNGDELSYRVMSLPAKGLLYQYSAAGLGSEITESGTAVEDATRIIYLPQPDLYGKACDSFLVICNDGEVDSNLATYSVTLVPKPYIEFEPSGYASNAFAFHFSGLTNVTYSIYRSLDLKSWVYLGTPSQLLPGQFHFVDTTVLGVPMRFYRVRSP